MISMKSCEEESAGKVGERRTKEEKGESMHGNPEITPKLDPSCHLAQTSVDMVRAEES